MIDWGVLFGNQVAALLSRYLEYVGGKEDDGNAKIIQDSLQVGGGWGFETMLLQWFWLSYCDAGVKCFEPFPSTIIGFPLTAVRNNHSFPRAVIRL